MVQGESKREATTLRAQGRERPLNLVFYLRVCETFSNDGYRLPWRPGLQKQGATVSCS